MTELPITVNGFDVGANGTMNLSSIMKYFQQAARLDLDSYGLGYEYMRSFHQIFVLCRYTFRIHDHIRADQSIVFITQPDCIKGPFFYRDFAARDTDGKTYVEASSAWVLIDYNDRSILRSSSLPKDCPSEGKLVDFSPSRTYVRFSSNQDYSVSVTYSMLDENRHLNNTRYADLIDDYLFFLGYDASYKELSIGFEHEALLNDRLFLSHQLSPDGKLVIRCDNDTKNALCFSAEVHV